MAKKKTSDQTPSTAAPAKRRTTTRKKVNEAPVDISAAPGNERNQPKDTALDRAGDTPRTGDSPSTSHQPPGYDEIAEAAYHRYLRRGGQPGDHFNDWVEAERELRDRKR